MRQDRFLPPRPVSHSSAVQVEPASADLDKAPRRNRCRFRDAQRKKNRQPTADSSQPQGGFQLHMNQLLDGNRARVKSLFPTRAITLLLLLDEDVRVVC